METPIGIGDVEGKKAAFSFNTQQKEVLRIMPDGSLHIYSKEKGRVVPIEELESNADAKTAAKLFYKTLRGLIDKCALKEVVK